MKHPDFEHQLARLPTVELQELHAREATRLEYLQGLDVVTRGARVGCFALTATIGTIGYEIGIFQALVPVNGTLVGVGLGLHYLHKRNARKLPHAERDLSATIHVLSARTIQE